MSDAAVVATKVVKHTVEHSLQCEPHAVDLFHRVVSVGLLCHVNELNCIGRSGATAHGLQSIKETQIVDVEIWTVCRLSDKLDLIF